MSEPERAANGAPYVMPDYVRAKYLKAKERRLRLVRASDGQVTEYGSRPAIAIEVESAEASNAPYYASHLLSRAQLAELPEPAPLIDNVLDLGTVALLAGYWGTFKSFIAQDWAACIATGKRWQGREVMRDSVLYVATEGAHGMHSRLSAWEQAWRHTIPGAEWNDIIQPAGFQVLPFPVNLGDPGQVTEICSLVEGGGYKLIIFDTLAKCMVGLDENSARDMGRVVDSLYHIRYASGIGTVLAVHHTGKDKATVRGSSALEAGVDTVWTTEGDASMINLIRTKRKDGATEARHNLRFEAIPESDSGIMIHRQDHEISGRQSDLMSVIMSAFSDTGCTKAELRAAANMPPATFSDALNALVKSGLVINTGTDKRPFYKLP